MKLATIEVPVESVPPVQTVPDLLAERVRLTPRAIGCRYRAADGTWASLTWEAYGDRVHRLAIQLRGLGVVRGDRVAIMMPTCLTWDLLEKAVLMIGAAVVGIDHHASIAHRSHILCHSQPIALFASCAKDLQGLELPMSPAIPAIVVIDGPPPPSSIFRGLTWRDLETLDREPLGSADPPKPGDAAAITYTSGTTGPPKGIVYSQQQMVLACRSILTAFDTISGNDTALCWLPLSNLFQRVMNLCAVGSGAVVCFVDDPKRIVEDIATYQPTVFIGVPRFYEKVRQGSLARIEALPAWQRRLARIALTIGATTARRHRGGEVIPCHQRAIHALLDAVVLSRLRAIMGSNIRLLITGSAPTSMPVLGFFESLGLPLLEAYGLSENLIPVAMNRPDDFKLGTVGRPLQPNEIRLASDGEVLVRGPGLFGGYLGDQGGPRIFTEDGFLATGDLGILDEQGYLRLVGRKREIIKTSTGRRIGPDGIEAALREVPAVEHALVVGNGRKTLIALLTLDPDWVGEETCAIHPAVLAKEPGPLANLRNYLGRALKDYNAVADNASRVAACLVLPERFSVSEGHLTPSLKLRRSWLEQRYAADIDWLYLDLERGDRIVEGRTGEPPIVLMKLAA